MHFKVLAVGDITGESGVAFLRRHLGRLKQEKGIAFAVVNAENPFTTADRVLKNADKPTFVLVDLHAQATSEKLAMSYYLDGRVSALWGTHTHVPTADEHVCPKGTGYITDLGMTGPRESVLGIRPEQSVEFFLGGLPGRYRTAEGACKLQGAIFTLDSGTGLCVGVERIEVL